MSYNKLTSVLDNLAIGLFGVIALLKGYRFLQVGSMKEEADFEKVNQSAGFSFPHEIENKLKIYRNGGVRFIAYHGRKPVGIVRLSDPNIVNRPYELYGVNKDCLHHEIQHLVVDRQHREGSQMVMLGLFKVMYSYSRYCGINSWMSCSSRSVYLTMRRYNKAIQLVEVDFEAIPNQITRYLHRHKVFDTCYTMEVNAFSPSAIFFRFIKFKTNAVINLISRVKWNRHSHESINYGSK